MRGAKPAAEGAAPVGALSGRRARVGVAALGLQQDFEPAVESSGRSGASSRSLGTLRCSVSARGGAGSPRCGCAAVGSLSGENSPVRRSRPRGRSLRGARVVHRVEGMPGRPRPCRMRSTRRSRPGERRRPQCELTGVKAEPELPAVGKSQGGCCTFVLHNASGAVSDLSDTAPDLGSGWRDLNPRPLRPERSALPSCATPRSNEYYSSGPAPWDEIRFRSGAPGRVGGAQVSTEGAVPRAAGAGPCRRGPSERPGVSYLARGPGLPGAGPA